MSIHLRTYNQQQVARTRCQQLVVSGALWTGRLEIDP